MFVNALNNVEGIVLPSLPKKAKKSVGFTQPLVPTTRLKDKLLGSMSSSSKSKPKGSGEWFRSSGLTYLCPREIQLSKAFEIEGTDSISSELAWIFGTGHAVHEKFQGDYLQSLGDVFQGWWQRHGSDGNLERATGKAKPNNNLFASWCPRPRSKDGGWQAGWSYEELEFVNKEYRLTGHCDGVLVWGEGDVEVLELKTISKWGWDKVDPSQMGQPKPEHIIQVNAYMWLTGIDKARIVYINKDMTLGLDKGVCEHLVERDEAVIDSIRDLLNDCIDASDSTLSEDYVNIRPRLAECKTVRSKRAKQCSSCNQCFEIKR